VHEGTEHKGNVAMPHTKRQQNTIKTTIGELAAAYYEAALSELHDPKAAERVASQMVLNAMKRQGR
jgi:hypothetical protein